MAHPIPVSATVQSGQAPLDDLRLDLFMVTQDGTIAKAVGSFPVAAGAAEVPEIPLADPALRWGIRIHRGGGHLGLDAPDGAPQALIDFVRDHVPSHFSMERLDMGADAQGRYVLTFHGRYAPLPFGQAQVEYRRAFGIAPGVADAARRRRHGLHAPDGLHDLDRARARGRGGRLQRRPDGRGPDRRDRLRALPAPRRGGLSAPLRQSSQSGPWARSA